MDKGYKAKDHKRSIQSLQISMGKAGRFLNVEIGSK